MKKENLRKPWPSSDSALKRRALCQACAIDVVGDNADQNVLELLTMMYDADIDKLFDDGSCSIGVDLNGLANSARPPT